MPDQNDQNNEPDQTDVARTGPWRRKRERNNDRPKENPLFDPSQYPKTRPAP